MKITEEISSNVEIKWKDTIIYEPEYIPVPVPGKKEIVEVPANVDTTAILQDYFAKYFYSDIVPIEYLGGSVVSDIIPIEWAGITTVQAFENIPIEWQYVVISTTPLISATWILDARGVVWILDRRIK